MVKQPNILLLMCDQMRGDCMGTAGHPDVKTPYLDSLARDGVRFVNAYSACPSCIPARAALFTGKSQERHGRVGYQDGVAWDYPDMLPQLLSNAGYHTEAVGKLHVHPPLRRCGFRNLTLHDGYIGYYRKPENPWIEHQFAHDAYIDFLKNRCGTGADVGDTGIECNSWITRPWIYDEMSHPTNWVTTETLKALHKRDRDLPFFIMASYVRPHPPWDAPVSYYDTYRQMQLREPASGDWDDPSRTEEDGRYYDSRFGTGDPELRRQGMAGYYACITHIDHQIGRIIKTLDQEKILEDTIVVFLSDHGEMLFDHSLFRKVVPYQGSINIPLIFRVGQNIAGGSRNAVCGRVVELRDIAPTLLEMAGADIPQSMDGRSLEPLLTGVSAGPVREYLHGEHSGGEASNHYIVSEKDKYIWFSQSGREQYFDLAHDPREEDDLIGAPGCQDRISILRGRLVQALSGREEGYTDGSRLIPGRPPQNLLNGVFTTGA
ncbi:arylsulfatase [Breznakiella homolactica]|uniref:Arylsulfatase n=1 Tax=Breznakiella homolactica TaxID=2798577 RepID=A0A7T7XN54_9SPIR|nr:arylsulfatase [Breznakiella homolactica]QQO09298.1 arylsulfatase [Breznakiella homolactica]